MRPLTLALALLVVVWPRPGSAEQVAGSVKTRVRPGASPAVAVIYAERLDATARPRPGTFTLGQKNKAFTPRVLAVPGGSEVAFPNDDPIFHNVFSLSPPQPFDLGLYRAGAAKTRVFTQPGVYHVFCNIHPQMVAFLVVAPSPFVATVAADGAWRLDLPPGRYRLTALSERAAPVSAEVIVGSAPMEAPALMLDESAGVAVAHSNKYGKPYPKAAYADR